MWFLDRQPRLRGRSSVEDGGRVQEEPLRGHREDPARRLHGRCRLQPAAHGATATEYRIRGRQQGRSGSRASTARVREQVRWPRSSGGWLRAPVPQSPPGDERVDEPDDGPTVLLRQGEDLVNLPLVKPAARRRDKENPGKRQSSLDRVGGGA